MKLHPGPITLPSPLQRRLEAAAESFIHPDAGPLVDFAKPAGEPALVAPDSVSWRVFRNPLPLFIGGVAAVVLELGEPRVRTGIWSHSTFLHDPLLRLQRTGLAAMMTVYGPRSQTEAMIAGVVKMHRRISGLTPLGLAYRADDPELLNWVHGTASFGFLEAYNAYVRRLSDSERDKYYAEGACSSRLYGAVGAPTSECQLNTLFEHMRDKLEASAIVFEFLGMMRRVPVLPRPLSAIQGMLVNAAVDILPAWIRERLELSARCRFSAWQRDAVRGAGALADRVVLKSSPAVQSCRRLGLPDDYLYRQPAE
jgi:uncharacterized protein (DUF2236 family)